MAVPASISDMEPLIRAGGPRRDAAGFIAIPGVADIILGRPGAASRERERETTRRKKRDRDREENSLGV